MRYLKPTFAAIVLAATASATSGQPSAVTFTIVNGKVVSHEPFAVKVSVLGAAINSGSYDRPVTVEMTLGGESIGPFGPHDQPVDSNVNVDRPVHNVIDSVYGPEDHLTITGRSWARESGTDGSSNDHWTLHHERNSFDSPYVKVLRDGDVVPDIEGFQDQASVEEFVRDYIDVESGTVTLNEHQAIFLFELGTNNLNSSAADFQDLVVVVTFGENVMEASINDVGVLLND